ncbi:MAG: 2-phosphosulfolactate phosphatase [Actinomycetota bacterium]
MNSNRRTDVNDEPFEPWPDAEVHLEHGPQAATLAAARGDVVVVVDVLSFSTTVSIAIERGAAVCALSADEITALGGRDAVADLHGAHVVAKDRADTEAKFTLSPASLGKVASGDRLVLTSLNGAQIVAAAAAAPATLIGSLRSRAATAAAVDQEIAERSRRVTLIAATEQWPSVAPGADGMRIAVEDWLGAGAIAAALAERGRALSLEAELAAHAAASHLPDIGRVLVRSISGRELIERGFAADVELAGEVDAASVAAIRQPDGFFRAAG